jgi:hypothetical protein
MLRVLRHEECLTGAYETKPTMCSRKQQFPTWIPSFRSWLVHDFRDHQRCISNHNSPKNHSITNLKRTLLSLLKHEECLTGAYETKRTTCSRKQQFPTWIPSFRSWLYMIFVTTNDAYPTITPPKITQLQIWNAHCWEHCNTMFVWSDRVKLNVEGDHLLCTIYHLVLHLSSVCCLQFVPKDLGGFQWYRRLQVGLGNLDGTDCYGEST